MKSKERIHYIRWIILRTQLSHLSSCITVEEFVHNMLEDILLIIMKYPTLQTLQKKGVSKMMDFLFHFQEKIYFSAFLEDNHLKQEVLLLNHL